MPNMVICSIEEEGRLGACSMDDVAECGIGCCEEEETTIETIHWEGGTVVEMVGQEEGRRGLITVGSSGGRGGYHITTEEEATMLGG